MKGFRINTLTQASVLFSQIVQYFEIVMSLVYLAAGVVVYLGLVPFLKDLSNSELYLISGGLVAYGTYRFYRSYKKIKESREEEQDEK